MTSTTTFPGLVSIDPIQGLVGYVQDIKPYHTKVFETLVEYVYTDYVNVNIVDVNVLGISVIEQDALDSTIVENNGSDLTVPASITEAFDFFATPPALAPAQAVQATDATSGVVYFSGDISPSGSNYVQFGDILNIEGSASNDGNYDVLGVAYLSGPNQTVVTLNMIPITDGSPSGTATFFETDTTYTFQFAIQEVVSPGPTIIDPATAGTGGEISFTAPIFVVNVNATRAVQPGSIFRVQGTTSNDGIYYAVYVNFVPGIDANGQRNVGDDTTTIGVGIPAGTPVTAPFVLPGNVVTEGAGGYIIPYNITGFDDRYDAPYDGMAGYHIISG